MQLDLYIPQLKRVLALLEEAKLNEWFDDLEYALSLPLSSPIQFHELIDFLSKIQGNDRVPVAIHEICDQIKKQFDRIKKETDEQIENEFKSTFYGQVCEWAKCLEPELQKEIRNAMIGTTGSEILSQLDAKLRYVSTLRIGMENRAGLEEFLREISRTLNKPYG